MYIYANNFNKNINLTEEQLMIQQVARFQTELLPGVIERDEHPEVSF